MAINMLKSPLCLLLQKSVQIPVVVQCGMARRAEMDGQTIVVCRLAMYPVQHMMHLHLAVTGAYIASVWLVALYH